jgi:hypothetical protein
MALIATVICWSDPFPLVHHPSGDLSTGLWLDRSLLAAACCSVIAFLCGAAGRGLSRVVLMAAGALLLVASYFGWLGNSV